MLLSRALQAGGASLELHLRKDGGIDYLFWSHIVLVQSGLNFFLYGVALLNCLLKSTECRWGGPVWPKRQFLGGGAPLETPGYTALVGEMSDSPSIIFFGQLPGVRR